MGTAEPLADEPHGATIAVYLHQGRCVIGTPSVDQRAVPGEVEQPVPVEANIDAIEHGHGLDAYLEGIEVDGSGPEGARPQKHQVTGGRQARRNSQHKGPLDAGAERAQTDSGTSLGTQPDGVRQRRAVGRDVRPAVIDFTSLGVDRRDPLGRAAVRREAGEALGAAEHDALRSNPGDAKRKGRHRVKRDRSSSTERNLLELLARNERHPRPVRGYGRRAFDPLGPRNGRGFGLIESTEKELRRSIGP